MNEDLKLESFSEADCEAFKKAWEHDQKLDDESRGKEISLDDYEFVLNANTFSTFNKVILDDLDYDSKKRFIKFCLECEGINNACIISNLVILAQGRLIDEELYDNDDIFFEDDIEYLDICTDLRTEINAFNTQIVSYFLGSLKSLSSLIPDGAEHIPNLYFNALSSYNLNTMSSAMQKVSVDYDALPFVINAELVVNRVCAKQSFVDEFMGELLQKITND